MGANNKSGENHHLYFPRPLLLHLHNYFSWMLYGPVKSISQVLYLVFADFLSCFLNRKLSDSICPLYTFLKPNTFLFLYLYFCLFKYKLHKKKNVACILTFNVKTSLIINNIFIMVIYYYTVHSRDQCIVNNVNLFKSSLCICISDDYTVQCTVLNDLFRHPCRTISAIIVFVF